MGHKLRPFFVFTKKWSDLRRIQSFHKDTHIFIFQDHQATIRIGLCVIRRFRNLFASTNGLGSNQHGPIFNRTKHKTMGPDWYACVCRRRHTRHCLVGCLVGRARFVRNGLVASDDICGHIGRCFDCTYVYLWVFLARYAKFCPKHWYANHTEWFKPDKLQLDGPSWFLLFAKFGPCSLEKERLSNRHYFWSAFSKNTKDNGCGCHWFIFRKHSILVSRKLFEWTGRRRRCRLHEFALNFQARSIQDFFVGRWRPLWYLSHSSLQARKHTGVSSSIVYRQSNEFKYDHWLLVSFSQYGRSDTRTNSSRSLWARQVHHSSNWCRTDTGHATTQARRSGFHDLESLARHYESAQSSFSTFARIASRRTEDVPLTWICRKNISKTFKFVRTNTRSCKSTNAISFKIRQDIQIFVKRSTNSFKRNIDGSYL